MFRLACVVATVLVLVPRDSAQTRVSRTSSGVYTTVQAARGEQVYMSECVGCHAAGTYSTPAFRKYWSGRTVADLFLLIRETMPKQEPASLAPRDYADVVAYMLKINDIPAGKTELSSDVAVLKRIRIDVGTTKR